MLRVVSAALRGEYTRVTRSIPRSANASRGSVTPRFRAAPSFTTDSAFRRDENDEMRDVERLCPAPRDDRHDTRLTQGTARNSKRGARV